MLISAKPLRNRNKSFYILSFKDQEEVDWFFDGIKSLEGHMADKDLPDFEKLFFKMKNNLTDKYAKPYAEFSTSLFEEDFLDFALWMTVFAIEGNALADSYMSKLTAAKTLIDAYDKCIPSTNISSD